MLRDFFCSASTTQGVHTHKASMTVLNLDLVTFSLPSVSEVRACSDKVQEKPGPRTVYNNAGGHKTAIHTYKQICMTARRTIRPLACSLDRPSCPPCGLPKLCGHGPSTRGPWAPQAQKPRAQGPNGPVASTVITQGCRLQLSCRSAR